MTDPVRKIRQWLAERNFSLQLDPTLEWKAFLADGIVTGNPKPFKHKRCMIVSILHECGHVDQYLDPFYAMPSLPKVKKGKKPKHSFYISILRAEMDAWDRAERIARDLAIPNLDSAFDTMKHVSLMTYVKWCARKGSIDVWFKKPEAQK